MFFLRRLGIAGFRTEKIKIQKLFLNPILGLIRACLYPKHSSSGHLGAEIEHETTVKLIFPVHGNTLAMGANMFRDPFLDQFFGNFLNL